MSESLALSQQTERNRHEAQGEGYEERRQGIAKTKTGKWSDAEEMRKTNSKQIAQMPAETIKGQEGAWRQVATTTPALSSDKEQNGR